ncbi:sulfite exporter TauE/SafE family protein [Vibrio sp. TH_r3]|uniref:sulfite exporter TauE/SafE family protein n=1 Tax=Vibrio sp. TH_r3 TaxID=3082084 RepID=UPI002953F492|nr:sulfite exporter TauE/SafE family protein [Vibrio sp. TH_r3]MDV7104350.1 sulfite exporter TauE/SafE family protein [Vibrio sp. TH_r3]
MLTNDWIAALLVGFLGSAHCVGMCGGIASVMSLNSVTKSERTLTTLLYNTGRITSYMIAGALVGGAISSAASLLQNYSVLNALRIMSALVMIILALYIGKWWHGLLYVEKFGQHLWKYISPFTKALLPLPSPLHALPLGLLWGWLPCGLVYSSLTWAAVSGSAFNGTLIMAAFGIGTLPSMLLVGLGANYVNKLKNSPLFRQSGAIILLGYGMYTLSQSINLFT